MVRTPLELHDNPRGAARSLALQVAPVIVPTNGGATAGISGAF